MANHTPPQQKVVGHKKKPQQKARGVKKSPHTTPTRALTTTPSATKYNPFNAANPTPHATAHNKAELLSVHTTQQRNINMYKYGPTKQPPTDAERHTAAQRKRRKEAEQQRYNKALQHYDQQLKHGVKDPILPAVKSVTAAQQRRLDIRKAMRDTIETGDLTHIPLMIRFMKKMHNLDKQDNDSKVTIQDDSTPQGVSLSTAHIKRVQEDAKVLQSYGLFSKNVQIGDLTATLQQQQQDQDQNNDNIATPLHRSKTAFLKNQGNVLSTAVLEPLAEMLGDEDKTKKIKQAQPIANFSGAVTQENKHHYQLQPASRTISGDIISTISLNHDEFGGAAGSPVFRLDPHGIEATKKHKKKHGLGGDDDDIVDEDDDILDRKVDAELALEGKGMLGLNDNIHHHHANELLTDQLVPSLGFLRSYTAPREDKEVDSIADIDGLQQDHLSGIGGLQRTPGHLSSPKKHAVISGRRARAIETIANTTAAVLTKKQLLAHNSSLLRAINPGLVGAAQRENKAKHYVDLYDLGYEITRIQLSQDLSTCTIFWASQCLFPLKEMQSEHNLERPLLDIVHKTLHGDDDGSGRVELNPLNESMKQLATSRTHVQRRAKNELGANYKPLEHEFTSPGDRAEHNRRLAQHPAGVEVFMDEETGVVVKRDNQTGDMRILSQGNPRLWELKGRFKKGSYVPGTIDLLPPQYRRNTQMMSKEQQRAKQKEQLLHQAMELQNMKAGLQGDVDIEAMNGGKSPDAKIHGMNLEEFMEANGMMFDKYGIIRFIEEDPNAQNYNSVEKGALEKVLLSNDNTTHQSTLSINTFHRCTAIVSVATNEYLNSIVPSIRWALGQALNTKYVPQIKFEFDSVYGEAKQRAHNINAVLHKQIQRQFAQKQNLQLVSINDDEQNFGGEGEDDDGENHRAPQSIEQNPLYHIQKKHTPNSPVLVLAKNELGQQRKKEFELLQEKKRLLEKGRLEEVKMIDDYIAETLSAEKEKKLKQIEEAGFDELGDGEEDAAYSDDEGAIDFTNNGYRHPDAAQVTAAPKIKVRNPITNTETSAADMIESERVLQDNIEKYKATAEMLKTGKENKLAVKTRLQYHDITANDKRKLVGIYLNMEPEEVKNISEERLETVLSMLRREMTIHNQKKEKQQLYEEKVKQGLSQRQIDAEMAKFDKKKMDELKNDPDFDDTTVRWQAGVDSDLAKPMHQFKQLIEDNPDEQEVVLKDNHPTGANGKNYDPGVASAFYKRQKDFAQDHATIKHNTLSKPSHPTAVAGAAAIAAGALDKEQLMKFRDQYVANDNKQPAKIQKKQQTETEESSYDSEESGSYDSESGSYDSESGSYDSEETGSNDSEEGTTEESTEEGSEQQEQPKKQKAKAQSETEESGNYDSDEGSYDSDEGSYDSDEGSYDSEDDDSYTESEEEEKPVKKNTAATTAAALGAAATAGAVLGAKGKQQQQQQQTKQQFSKPQQTQQNKSQQTQQLGKKQPQQQFKKKFSTTSVQQDEDLIFSPKFERMMSDQLSGNLMPRRM